MHSVHVRHDLILVYCHFGAEFIKRVGADPNILA
jgi:hypothetical protein